MNKQQKSLKNLELRNGTEKIIKLNTQATVELSRDVIESE
jgi:hypothetical protein